MYISTQNMLFNGKEVCIGEEVSVAGLSERQINVIVKSRKIELAGKNPTKTETYSPAHDLSEEKNKHEQTQEEEFLEPQKKHEAGGLSRKEMEDRYRDLGGRLHAKWTDEELKEKLEKKESE